MFLEDSKNQVCERLKAISCTAALQIKGEQLIQLQKEAPGKDDILMNDQHPVYHELYNFLRQTYEINNLKSPVYIMVFNDTLKKFQFLATSSKVPYYKHDYELYPRQLLDNFNTGGVLDVYEDENGSWISAFAPIRDANGNPVALLQVDERFDDFLDNVWRGLISNIVIALIILLPTSLFFYSIINGMLMNEEDSRRFLKEKNEEIQIQNEMIKQNNDRLEEAKKIIELQNRDLDLKVRKRTYELLKANRDLETFLYRSSHDIQGPLATLKGLCYIAEKDSKYKETTDLVQMISNSTNKLSTVIDGIEEVYHIKIRKLKKETFVLGDVLDEIKKNYQPDILKSSVDFQIHQNDVVELTTDLEMFRMVLNELIKNAFQYGLSHVHPQIIVTAFKQHGIFSLSVSDNGGNFDDEVRKSMVKIFQKGVITSMDVGLGLYGVYLAVRRLNGTIRFNMENPEITRFDLSFDGL